MILNNNHLIDLHFPWFSERPLEMERHDVSFVLYKVIEDKIGADIDLV